MSSSPLKFEICVGNAREVLRGLADESIHCIVTSPPYWSLRDYQTAPSIWGGKNDCRHEWIETKHNPQPHGDTGANGGLGGGHKSQVATRVGVISSGYCRRCHAWRGSLGLEPELDQYVDNLVEVFREARRVLRKDGTMWLNLGDSYAGSWGRNGDAGGGQWSRSAPQFDRPAYAGKEDWRPSTSLKQSPASRWRPGAGRADGKVDMRGQRNRNGCGAVAGLKPKDLCGIPWRAAMALQEDGWWLRSCVVWVKPNSLPESVRDRPVSSHEFVFMFARSKRYFYNYSASRNESATMQNLRNVWTIPTEPFPLAHFAVFPRELARRCVSLGTTDHGVCSACGCPREQTFVKGKLPSAGHRGSRFDRGKTAQRDGGDRTQPGRRFASVEGGVRITCACRADIIAPVVLDPFAGSGTVGVVCKTIGRSFIGIELNPEYAEMARKRIAGAHPGTGNYRPDRNESFPLFTGVDCG